MDREGDGLAVALGGREFAFAVGPEHRGMGDSVGLVGDHADAGRHGERTRNQIGDAAGALGVAPGRPAGDDVVVVARLRSEAIVLGRVQAVHRGVGSGVVVAAGAPAYSAGGVVAGIGAGVLQQLEVPVAGVYVDVENGGGRPQSVAVGGVRVGPALQPVFGVVDAARNRRDEVEVDVQHRGAGGDVVDDRRGRRQSQRVMRYAGHAFVQGAGNRFGEFAQIEGRKVVAGLIQFLTAIGVDRADVVADEIGAVVARIAGPHLVGAAVVGNDGRRGGPGRRGQLLLGHADRGRAFGPGVENVGRQAGIGVETAGAQGEVVPAGDERALDGLLHLIVVHHHAQVDVGSAPGVEVQVLHRPPRVQLQAGP